jgi:hypothetical protein
MLDTLKTTLKLNNSNLLREQAYIDGAWVSAADGSTFPVTNPADGSLVANVPQLGVSETRAAIEAANAAWPAWRSRTAKERAAILRRWFDLMVANKDDLAAIMTAEQGKPLAESAGEVMYGASFIEWFAEEAKRVYGDVIPTHLPDRRILRRRGRCGNALEFSQRYDHAEVWPGDGRRLPGGHQACLRDAPVGSGAGGAGRGSGRPGGRVQRDHHDRLPRRG